MQKITDISEITRHLIEDDWSFTNRCIAYFKSRGSTLIFTSRAIAALAEQIATMRIIDPDECAKGILKKKILHQVRIIQKKEYCIWVKYDACHITEDICPEIIPIYQNDIFLSPEDYM